MSNDIDVSGFEKGIQRAYSLNSWMADLHSSIKHLKIGELSLAGAHNAGMDKKASHAGSLVTCQDESFRHQLDNGVRALDIRLEWYAGFGADNVNSGLVFFHKLTSGRTFANMLNDIDRFHEANPGEIVILDFHEIAAQRNDKPVPYAAIHAHFMRHYTRKMLPRSAASLTLEQIRTQYPGPRFIVAVPDEVCERRDNTYFWDKIDHQWGGGTFVSEERLFSFIGQVMANPPASNIPWSLSATTYGLGGPGDIVGRLRDRFPVGSDWQRKSSIINFDWCTRSGAAMIRQCIESNAFKGRQLAITRPFQGETYFNGASSVKGVGIPGATITLHDTGAGWYDGGVVNAEGIWEAKVNLFPVSNHPLKCKQKFNGIESDWSSIVSFNVRDQIPTPTINTPVNGSEVKSTRPWISGANGVPGATVRFLQTNVGSVIHGTAVVGPDGKWQSVVVVPLPVGRFSLTCDQFGSGWQSGYATPSTFTVLDGPTPPINISVAVGNSYADINWGVNAVDVGNGTTFECYLNDERKEALSTTVQRFDNLLDNVPYTAKVVAVNELGVRSEPVAVNFMIASD